MTELSFRGYDVVAVSTYIAGERDPLLHVGSAKGMNFASRKGRGRGMREFNRRAARFQAKLNMKLRDRFGSSSVPFAGEIQCRACRPRLSCLSSERCSKALNFILRSE